MPRSGTPSKRKGPRARRRAINAIKAQEIGALAEGALILAPNQDGRGRIARRAKRIAKSLMDELGGEARLPYWKVALCQRIAFASISCEIIEAKMLTGQEADYHLHGMAVRTMSSMMQRLGLEVHHRPGTYENERSPDDDHEVNEIRRVIVYPKDAPPEDHPAFTRTNQRT